MNIAKESLNNIKEKKKKNKNVNKKGSGIIFPSFDIPMVSVFENYFSKEPIKKVRLDTFLPAL